MTTDITETFTDSPVPVAEFRRRIEALESAIKSGIQDGRLENWSDRETASDSFTDRDERFDCFMGVRRASAPTGSVIIGKVHRYPHVVFVMQGEAIVATEHGARRVSAPDLMICPAETKRAIIVLQDAVWASVHLAEAANSESLQRVVAESFATLEDQR